MRSENGRMAQMPQEHSPGSHAELGLRIKSLRLDWALLRLVRLHRSVIAATKQGRNGFDPNQPRVPAGQPDGGQWTDDDGDDGIVILVGGRGGRGSGTLGRSGRRYLGATTAQEMRLAASENALKAALSRVQRVDPRWRPQPQLSESIEGKISANANMTREAELRFLELQAKGVGPGRFAKESLPARGPKKRFTDQERREINRIGRETGCHTCGTKEPRTKTGNFIPDHQLPTARLRDNGAQRLFPHCTTCSASQGGWVRHNKGD